MGNDWNNPTDFITVCKRVGGRKKYNAHRRRQARARQGDVARLLKIYGQRRGVVTLIAKELKTSKATICRDLKALRLGRWQERGRKDPA